jgi:hypothetical protein
MHDVEGVSFRLSSSLFNIRICSRISVSLNSDYHRRIITPTVSQPEAGIFSISSKVN